MALEYSPTLGFTQFLQSQTRAILFFVEGEFESVAKAYAEALEGELEPVAPASDPSLDLFTPTILPSENTLVEVANSDWVVVFHRFASFELSEIDQMEDVTASLAKAGRLLRVVMLGRATPTTCELFEGGEKRSLTVEIDRDLRCSLVTEFAEFAAEMGVEIQGESADPSEVFEDYDHLLASLTISFFFIGAESEQIKIAPSRIEEANRVSRVLCNEE